MELAKLVLAESWGNIARAADALGIPARDFILSGKGARRGWTRPAGAAVTIEQPLRRVMLQWVDGTKVGQTGG
jgi:hypothetical protein